jgi:hypothetical protein
VSHETLLRLALLGVACVLLASAFVPPAWKLVKSALAARPAERGDASLNQDLEFVLQLAARSNTRGDAEAVKLCQQLIDSMLRSSSPPRPQA